MIDRDLVVFGAGGGTGLELARQARALGWTVTGVIRPDADPRDLSGSGCEVAEADALDPRQVAGVFARSRPGRTVVSTLGGRPGRPPVDYLGNAAVIDAAAREKTERMVLVSSLGCGDSRAFASERLLAAIGDILLEKTRAEDRLRTSGLPFAILRPGGLIADPPTGQGALYENPRVHGRISRSDLAAIILLCLTSEKVLGRTLSVVDRTSPAAPKDIAEFQI